MTELTLTVAQTLALNQARAPQSDYKVLEALMNCPESRMTEREIAAASGVSLATANRSIKRLMSLGLIGIWKSSDGNAARYATFSSDENRPVTPFSSDERAIHVHHPYLNGDMNVYPIPREAIPPRPGPQLTLYLAYMDYFNPHQSRPMRWLDARHDAPPNAYRNACYVIIEPDGTETPGEPLPLAEYEWHDTTATIGDNQP